MIEFYHDKGIYMLKLGCTLPNLANICLQKSTDYKFYPFFSNDSDSLEKIRGASNARRASDENPLSGVVAETMKLLGNSSYGYQTMDRSKHTLAKYLGDKKNHKAINNQYFKKLNIVAKDLYEVELVKSTIEHREPIILGFFILQYSKLRLLELYYNFFENFCDVNKFEELEMDTDYLYLAMAEDDLDDCILPSKRAEWTEKQSKNCRDKFRPDAKN